VRNIDGPVHDLASVLTKLIDCGMTLPEAIRGITSHPRRVLGMTDPWLAADGTIRHATVFRVTRHAPPGRRYVDATGQAMTPSDHVVPVATIRNGLMRATTG
jgi:dihydroorotase